MRYIDISKLALVASNLKWDVIKKKHKVAMGLLTIPQRKKYINDNPDWNVFQEEMLKLSNNKCWYSEAPIGNADFEVDHFRPKNKSKEKINYKDPKSKSIVHKENGYWWLAYNWDNYRLAGALANKRRRDRLGDCDDVKGKGDYFPLDLSGVGVVAADEVNISCEIPVLLDPTKQSDVGLISFDSNGEVISAGLDDYEDNRVWQSIFYYHLDLDQLNKERNMAWKDCEREILEIKDAIDNAPDERVKRIVLSSCFKKISDYIKNPDRSYTSVAKTCVMVYSEMDGFIWLKRFVKSNLL